MSGGRAFAPAFAATLTFPLPDGGEDFGNLLLVILDNETVLRALCENQEVPVGFPPRFRSVEAALSSSTRQYVRTFSSGFMTVAYRDVVALADGGYMEVVRQTHRSPSTITINSYDAGSLTGGLALSFDEVDGGTATLNGPFDAPYCGVLR